MALKATVCKAQLQVSDMDRGYYAAHALTLAQHPSETVERLMVRLLAFSLFADELLQFGRGVSSDDEPDLWQRSLDGRIEHWIDLGQPDESRIRRACGRSEAVTVIGYAPRSFDPWWDKHGAALVALKPLQVLCLPMGAAESLAGLHGRSMDLQCLIQDGTVQLIDAAQTVEITPRWLKRQD
ncbi:YaeQ family protein [Pseudomarimonas salicorniae]|uniref:YaeQ family protein n=1 Tax=Pseudomarimonas salicorniae TaxID=2933270 RepID=A0ABT0GK30_9GAMM|nr:YaeQ family protein [Lysobacter sp. CAU 1642]MCK7594907.1 YaeQ family protein [Lysobacter sp. CAU 1642]